MNVGEFPKLMLNLVNYKIKSKKISNKNVEVEMKTIITISYILTISYFNIKFEEYQYSKKMLKSNDVTCDYDF